MEIVNSFNTDIIIRVFMKKLLLTVSMFFVASAFAEAEKSTFEKDIAELKSAEQKRRTKEAIEKNFAKYKEQKLVGLGLLCLAGGSVVLAGGWGAVLGFFAVIGNGTQAEWLRAFSIVGVPALTVAATSGYFGSKMLLSNKYRLLQDPRLLKNQQKQ